jgi:hypothetical protein
MNRLIVGALCAGLAASALGGCATTSSTATAGSTTSSTELDLGKALALATSGVDAAVDGAEIAHKNGVLVGANWTAAQAAAKQADGLIDAADSAYATGDLTTAEASLAGIPALVSTIKSLTSPPATTAQ